MRLVFRGSGYYSASDAGFFTSGEERDLPQAVADRLLRDFPEYFDRLDNPVFYDNLDYSPILSKPAHELIGLVRGGAYDPELRALAGEEQQSDNPRKSVLEAIFARIKKIGA